MTSEELKPCPFCGGAVELERARIDGTAMYGRREWWGVKCRNTINLGGTCAIEQTPSASKEAAIERWNRRATPPSPSTANQIDRLKSAIEGECEGLAITDQQASAILAYLSPSTASEVGELPPLPEPEYPAIMAGLGTKKRAGYTAEQVREAQRQAYAIGRGSAVRDYVNLNDAALEAKPAAREVDVEAERKACEAAHGGAWALAPEKDRELIVMGWLAARRTKAEGATIKQISDSELLAWMRPHLDNDDGGYLCKTEPQAVIAAGRAAIAAVQNDEREGETKNRMLEARYNELIFAVARKFPGESRHETALRYIRAAEAPQLGTAKQSAEQQKGGGDA